MIESSVCVDGQFGPTIGRDCRGGFDFSLLFEQSILGLLPSSLFILVFFWRIIHLSGEKVVVYLNRPRLAKAALAVILFGLQVALLATWTTNDERRDGQGPKISISYAAVNVVAGLQVAILAWLEDARSIKPSSVLTAYLLLTLLFDAAQLRTLWLLSRMTTEAGILSASVGVKGCLLILESRNKTAYLVQTSDEKLPRQATSGIISHSLLWWLNKLFLYGFHATISIEDLDRLEPRLDSSRLSRRVIKAWQKRRQPERRLEFAWVICKTLWRQLLAAAIPRFCQIGFTFAQPLLIQRVIRLMSQPDDQMSRNQGYGLIGATFLIYLGIAVSTVHYNVNNARFLTMFRGAAVTLIYNQALINENDKFDSASAITLMSTDVLRITTSIETLNDCWARFIEVVLAITLLALQLGWTCIIPIVILLASSFGSGQVSKFIGNRQKIWVDAVQKRITMTSSMLADMKSVKMLGLSDFFRNTIQRHRVEETRKMAGYRWCIVWLNVVGNIPSIYNASLTFAVYAIIASVQGNHTLDTARAFTSLALLSLLAEPAAMLLVVGPVTMSSIGCFDRIQAFLTIPERRDLRELPPLSRAPSSTDDDVEGRNGAIALHPFHRSKSDLSNNDAVVVQDLDVRPAPSADFAWRSVTFTVPTGSLTMIIGHVGSGKSTLLKAVLGELPWEKGSISMSTRSTALCTQTPWLPNATIRQTICGLIDDVDFDDTWYQQTLRACCLDYDINLLADGDATVIGNGGTILSGGQQHRIALARAVYSRARLFVLDDVLAALDVKTQRLVFQQLFGEDGLLKKLDSTVILVTHAVEYLRHADKIIVLDDGGVSHQGTYQDALQQGWAHVAKDISSDYDVNDETQKGGVAEEDQGTDKPQENDASLKATQMKERAAEIAKREKLDDMKRSSGDAALYGYYYSFIGFRQAAIFLTGVIINTFGLYFPSIWLKWWSDIGGGQIPLYISVFVALSIIAGAGSFTYLWSLLTKIAPSTAWKTHKVLLDTVVKAPQSFFSETDVGSILNRFSQDMTLIEGSLPIGVIYTVPSVFQCLAAIALIATGSAYMGITVPFLLIAVGGLQHVYLRTSRQLRLLDIEANSPLYTHFLETLKGQSTIRAMNWESRSRDRLFNLLDTSQRPYFLFQCIQLWLEMVLSLMTGALAVIVVGLATGLRSTTDPGLLGVSLTNVLGFNAIVTSMVQGFIMFETSLGSLARLKTLSDTLKPEDYEKSTSEPSLTWPERGHVEFRNVSATHSSSSAGIYDVCLDIQPGQKVGICGRTGSGKSSLVSTMLGLLNINSGTIAIDGVDLSTMPTESVRQRLVAIPQNPVIILGTIRLNMDPHGQHDDSRITDVLKKVELWAWVEDRGGLNAEMTTESMSQGQQQLLSLARALLRSGSVLLLDEATSNMDNQTNAMVQEVIREHFASWTVISISHRLHDVMGYDLIVVIGDGRVVEVGQPDELRSRGGHFAQLLASS